MDGNKSKMVKALGSSEEAVFLQHRLDDMNQRWSDLKAKSANIRLVNLFPIPTNRNMCPSTTVYSHRAQIAVFCSFAAASWQRVSIVAEVQVGLCLTIKKKPVAHTLQKTIITHQISTT